MANGNGSALTPAKTIGICVTLSGIIFTIGATYHSAQMEEHAYELQELRREMNQRTDQRYRQSDANRDFRLVEFRFERNEKNIDSCMEFIKEHDHDMPGMRLTSSD
jgi:hypothetical protein